MKVDACGERFGRKLGPQGMSGYSPLCSDLFGYIRIHYEFFPHVIGEVIEQVSVFARPPSDDRVSWIVRLFLVQDAHRHAVLSRSSCNRSSCTKREPAFLTRRVFAFSQNMDCCNDLFRPLALKEFDPRCRELVFIGSHSERVWEDANNVIIGILA